MRLYDNKGNTITNLTIKEMHDIVDAVVGGFGTGDANYVGVELYIAADSHGEVWLYTLPPHISSDVDVDWTQSYEYHNNASHWVRCERELSIPNWKESLTKIRVMKGVDKTLSFVIDGCSYYLERVV